MKKKSSSIRKISSQAPKSKRLLNYSKTKFLSSQTRSSPRAGRRLFHWMARRGQEVKCVEGLFLPGIAPLYGCESWTIKKAEGGRIDDFQLSCWRRLLNGPCTARRSNQSIPKEINLEYSLLRTDADTEAPILWPPDAKSCFIRKDTDAGKD